MHLKVPMSFCQGLSILSCSAQIILKNVLGNCILVLIHTQEILDTANTQISIVIGIKKLSMSVIGCH